MAEIEQYKEEITESLNNLDKLINRSPLFSSDQKKWKSQYTALVRKIKKDMEGLSEEIKELPRGQSDRHVGTVKSFEKKLEKLEHDFQTKLRGGSISEKATELNNQPQHDPNARILEVFQRGDNAHARIDEALNSMDRTVEEGIQLAADINLQLNKQIEQLDRMTDKVKDTHSTLKRAQKNINYFLKALECDKCMLGMIIMIILALVAVVVLLIKKKTGG